MSESRGISLPQVERLKMSFAIWLIVPKWASTKP